MNRCSCYKKNALQCSRDASTKQGTDQRFCWQHQACKRNTQPTKQPAKEVPKQSPKQASNQPIKHSIEIFRNVTGGGLWICGDTDKYKDQLETIGAHYLPPKDCYVAAVKHQKEILDFFGMNESQIQPKFQGKYQPPKHSIEIFRNVTGAGLWICGDINKYKDQLETIGAHYLPPKDCYVVAVKHQKEVLDLFDMNESQIQPKFQGKYHPK